MRLLKWIVGLAACAYIWAGMPVTAEMIAPDDLTAAPLSIPAP